MNSQILKRKMKRKTNQNKNKNLKRNGIKIKKPRIHLKLIKYS